MTRKTRTKTKTRTGDSKKHPDVDVDELESIKSDYDYILTDLQSDLGNYEGKFDEIESRLEDQGVDTSQITALKEALSSLMYAEDEFSIEADVDELIPEEDEDEDD